MGGLNYCANCGAELTGSRRFCSNCGAGAEQLLDEEHTKPRSQASPRKLPGVGPVDMSGARLAAFLAWLSVFLLVLGFLVPFWVTSRGPESLFTLMFGSRPVELWPLLYWLVLLPPLAAALVIESRLAVSRWLLGLTAIATLALCLLAIGPMFVMTPTPQSDVGLSWAFVPWTGAGVSMLSSVYFLGERQRRMSVSLVGLTVVAAVLLASFAGVAFTAVKWNVSTPERAAIRWAANPDKSMRFPSLLASELSGKNVEIAIDSVEVVDTTRYADRAEVTLHLKTITNVDGEVREGEGNLTLEVERTRASLTQFPFWVVRQVLDESE